MVKPTQRDVDRAVEESMNRFKQARVGTVAPVGPRRPENVLLILDGSSQDPLGIAISRKLQERFDCSVAVADAREGAGSDDVVRHTASSLNGLAVPKASGESFNQILEAAGRSKCDLLVVPCPYGRDLESVGPTSAGTVIDVLLARSPVPILVLRKPFEPEGEIFGRVVLVLTAENEAAPHAAAWAAGLVAPGGSLQLELVLEREMRENIHALLQSIAPEVEVSAESLSQALAKTHMRLHRSLQKTSVEAGFEYGLRLQHEGEAGGVPPEQETASSLVVLALERGDHASQGTVQDRIRLSSHPLLVVAID